jgi:hypothetical protein
MDHYLHTHYTLDITYILAIKPTAAKATASKIEDRPRPVILLAFAADERLPWDWTGPLPPLVEVVPAPDLARQPTHMVTEVPKSECPIVL